MRAYELLDESVNFQPVTKKKFSDGQEYYTSEDFEDEVDDECWACDGTGLDPYRDNSVCDYCNGKKTYKHHKPRYPEMNVANNNATLIADMVGVPYSGDEYHGVWTNNQLPDVKRSLIRLLNKDASKHTRNTEVSRDTRITKDDNGLSRISSGPKVYSMGVDEARVKQYAERLLAIVDFAQKHNSDVSWS